MNNIFLKSFLFSVLYVGIATLNLIYLMESWSIFSAIIYFLTLPASIFGFGIIYTTVDYLGLLLLCQTFTLLILWFLSYRYFKKKASIKNSPLYCEDVLDSNQF